MQPHLLALGALTLPLVAHSGPELPPRQWRPSLPMGNVTLVASDAERVRPLADALRRAGATVAAATPEEVLDATGLAWRPEVLATTVIALGGIHTNRAMLPLYGGYLSFSDGFYPGAGGYTIRSIPRPFGSGTAAIALEASDAAGEVTAVAGFCELVDATDGLDLAHTLEAHLSPDCAAAAGSAPDPGMRYALTGDAREAADGIARLRQTADPQVGYFAFGDYGIERWVREYGYLQDAPDVPPDVVAALDQALLNTATASAGLWWRRADGQMIGGRHQTMGTSCFAAAVHLLRRRGQANAEAAELLDKWWAESRAYWEHACSTFHDDLEGIPSYYCPEPTIDWALMMGLPGYLQEQLPLAALRAYCVTDNLGLYAGTGTYEECRPGDLYKTVPRGWLLDACEFFHPNEGYGWLRDNTPHAASSTWALGRCFAGVRRFRAGQDDREPTRLLGITALPLGPQRYAALSHDAAEAREKGQRYLAAPEERCFEKLTFRDSFDTRGQYLVLEGFQTASADNQPPMDANSIIRYTDLGHVWLHANTEKSGNLPRSAVFCSDGSGDTPQPAGCELQALYSGERLGLAASHFPDYTACDWTRNVIWRRGAYFVVLDLLKQTREGRFGLICSFRTPQRAWLAEDGMLAREGDARMHVRNADAVRLSLDGGDELEGAAIPTLLRESRSLEGGVGSVVAFRNLVYATDPTRELGLEIRPLGDSAAMVRGTIAGEQELALIAAAPAGEGIAVGQIRTDAQVLYLGAVGWAQAGGTGISVGGVEVAGSAGSLGAELTAALEALWAQTGPVQRPQVAAGEVETAAPVWSFDGFSPLPPTVPAPGLTCEPAAEGNMASLLDGVVERRPTVRWPSGAQVSLELDLRERMPIRRIDFNVGVLGPQNAIPDPAAYPPPRSVLAQFSDDASGQGARERELTFTGDCTFEGLHKGVVYPILRWTSEEVGESCRYLRLTFMPDHWPGLGLNELSVRTEGLSVARVSGFVQRDADGDGIDDLLVWSDRSELAALRMDGTALWRSRFPGHITAAECYTGLGPDGPRVLVTTREARLYCLDHRGRELWRTDSLDSAKLNGDLPTGYSIGLLRRPDGAPLTVVGNYNLATFVSPDGEVLKYERLPAAYQTMTLSQGFDYDGDGVEDTVSTEVWGCLSVLDATMRRRAGGSLPRGRGVMLEYLRPPTATEAKAVVCTETGCGILDLKTLKYDWLQSVGPIADCAMADLDGDGRIEIALAKQDGYVLVFDEMGQLRHSTFVGEPVRAIAALPDGRLALALPGRVISHKVTTGAQETLAIGDVRRLAVSTDAGLLLAFSAGARVEAYSLR